MPDLLLLAAPLWSLTGARLALFVTLLLLLSWAAWCAGYHRGRATRRTVVVMRDHLPPRPPAPVNRRSWARLGQTGRLIASQYRNTPPPPPPQRPTRRPGH